MSVRIMVSYDGEWVKSPEGGIFRFNGCKAKGLSIPKKITYRELLDRVYRLLMVDPNEFFISMKFLFASSLPVAPAEIVNDDDVNFFIGENSSKVSLRTPLCVTLVRRSSNGQQIAYGEGSSQTFNILPETQEQTCEPFVPLTGVEENEPECCVNNSCEEDEDVGTSSAKLAPEAVSVEPQLGSEHPQSTDNTTLVDPINTVAPATTVAPRSRASRNPTQWITTKEALSAIRKGASAASTKRNLPARRKKKKPSSTKEPLTASSLNHSKELEIGQWISSKKELQEMLSMFAIKENFEFKVKKSSKDVFVVVCIDDDCEWLVRAIRVRDSTSFKIRKLVKDHSCSMESRHNEHRQASSWLIGQHIKSKCQGTNRTYKPKEIIEDMRREFGVNLSYAKAWRASGIAMNSENEPHRRRLWSTESSRKRKLSPKEDRPGRKCGRCGGLGHYRQTCPTAYPQFLNGGSVDTQDEVPNN